MGAQNQRSSSCNDKKRNETDETDSPPLPSSSPLTIRTIEMTSPIKETFNRTIAEAEAAYSVRFIGVEVEREGESLLRGSYPEQGNGPFPQEANSSDHRPLLINTNQGRALLREVLMAEHTVHGTPRV